MDILKDNRKIMLTTILLCGLMSTETALGGSTKAAMCKMDNECHVLAEAAYHEARGESDMGVVAIMHVAVNRKDNNEYFARQTTLRDVIFAKHQFSYISDGSRKRGMKDKEQLDRMLVLAYDVLHNNVEDVTSGSLYYHANYVSPYWSKHLEYTVTIGNHLFYK